MSKVYVRTNVPFPYVHEGNRIEIVEPGSVVSMEEDDARYFVETQGRGEYVSGPEFLARSRPDASPEVERPSISPKPARAEQATGRAQRVGSV